MAGDTLTRRAIEWHRARQHAICDSNEPWAHGRVLRAGAYPGYWDFNLVRVEDDPGLSAAELVAFADKVLAGLAHRRIDFELVAAGERLREDFAALGFISTRLLSMHHTGRRPAAAAIAVDVVPYDAVHALRVAWHQEDFPGTDASGYHSQAKEVAARRSAQVLAVVEAGRPVAFAQLEHADGAAEIAQVYVAPQRRGGGLGTALTTAAIQAASGARDLWIYADDEDRPKHLYERLGFAPAWTSMEFTRLPPIP